MCIYIYIYTYICIYTYIHYTVLSYYILYYNSWEWREQRGSRRMGVASKTLVRSRFAIDSLHVQTLTPTDAQTPFLGPPSSPLSWGVGDRQASCARASVCDACDVSMHLCSYATCDHCLKRLLRSLHSPLQCMVFETRVPEGSRKKSQQQYV